MVQIFNPPAIIDITASGVDLSGVDPASVNIYYDNQETGQWEVMESDQIVVNQNEGRIEIVGAKLPHFSRYSIGAE